MFTLFDYLFYLLKRTKLDIQEIPEYIEEETEDYIEVYHEFTFKNDDDGNSFIF